MKNLYKKIYDDLVKQEDKALAERDKKFHKYDGHLLFMDVPIF